MTKLKIATQGLCLTLTGLGLQLNAHFVSAAELTIKSSEEGASVYEVTGEGSKQKETFLGQTPWVIKEVESSEFKVYKVEKAGFTPVYLPLTQKLKASTSMSVTLHKAEDWAPSDIEKRSLQAAEQIVDQVYTIQSLLDARKTSEALGMAENLRAMHPSSFSVRLVYANALLVSGDVSKAKSMYTTLLNEVPPSRISVRDSIQQIVSRLNGSRMPASKKAQKGNN